MMQTVICTKWGTRYSSDFVNRLWSMIKRNTKRPTRLICYTDDPRGVNEEVLTFPMPEIKLPDPHKMSTWRKVAVWQTMLEGTEGDVLYIDLDVVITGSIDEFFDYEPQSTFCVIENWTQYGTGIGNTSVFRFRIGSHVYLFDKMEQSPELIFPAHANEQTYVCREIKEKAFWPKGWCENFKHTMLPKWPLNFVKTAPLYPETKIVCFTGRPDPDEARDGVWRAPWYKKIYKYVKPTPWIAEHWR